MRARSRRFLPILAAVAVTALLAGGPPLAAAAFDALNADKVDGFHAVGAGATAAQRAGKLVAANSAGRLPNSIIAKAPDAELLDGLNSTALQKRVFGTCSDAQKMTAVAGGGGVTCSPDRIDGGNAAELDGYDSSEIQVGVRTVFVSPIGTPEENGAALAVALASKVPVSGADAPSFENRWLVKIEPATYDMTAVPKLTMREFVDVEGSGPGTLITCACGNVLVDGPSSAAAIVGANNAELRNLRVINFGGGPGEDVYAIGIANPSVVKDVMVETFAQAGAENGVGIWMQGGGQLSLSRSIIDIGGAHSASGLWLADGFHEITDARVEAFAAAGAGYGLVNISGAASVRSSSLQGVGPADAPNNSSAVRVDVGAVTIQDSVLTAEGPSSRSIKVGPEAGAAAATSMLNRPVTGDVTCVHSYNALYLPVTDNCVGA